METCQKRYGYPCLIQCEYCRTFLMQTHTTMSNEKETGLTEESMRNAVMLTVGEKHEIINATIERMGVLEKSSVKYFLETGSINGSFRQRLYEIMSLSCDKAAAAIYKAHIEEIEKLKVQIAELKKSR